MKLNPDCIRDILLSIEDVTDSENTFRYSSYKATHKRLAEYSHNEILYHLRQCNMSGLLAGFTPCDGGNLVIVRDLSPAGHEFLANIRQDNIWNSTKEISAKIGAGSLSTLLQIAVNVVSELVKGHFTII